MLEPEGRSGNPPPQPEQATMRSPKPYTVSRNGRFLFTIFAYTEQQARTLIAARLADMTGIEIVKVSK